MSADMSAELIRLLTTLEESELPDGCDELHCGRLVSRIKELGNELLANKFGKPDYALINSVEEKTKARIGGIRVDGNGWASCHLSTPKGFIRFAFY